MSKLKYSKEQLEIIVQKSQSVSHVIRQLGLKEAGGNHSYISKIIKEFEIDTSHFTGQASNRGPNHKGGPDKLKPDQILVFNRNAGRREDAYRLRYALTESGVEHKCEACGLPPIWNGKPITLQIDHRDGNGLNNLKENLRFICPNCHSQTSNYGAKNIAKK